ncbi:MAG: glycosyltransferase family 9 protein [Bacteroidetes bacterium]|nr:MAG: glycosyltransferase family 9 protein [Bacteroidota bacterium]
MTRKRALIVVQRFIGDTLLATPLARSLHAADYSVDWLIPPSSTSLVAPLPWTNKTLSFGKGLGAVWNMLRNIYGQYDDIFLMTPSDKPAFVSALAGARLHGLFSPRYTDWWKRSVAKTVLIYQGDRHIASYAFRLAERLGKLDTRSIIYPFTDHDHEKVNHWVGTSHYLVVHPFARWNYKRWPEQSWRGLFTLLERTGRTIVVTGSPDEKDKILELTKDIEGNIKVAAGTFSWPELAALLSGAKAYIGVDTVMTHLAAASEVPTIALFGPTDPTIWGPWPNRHPGETPWDKTSPDGVQHEGCVYILQGLQACVPCHREGCERHLRSHSACLDSITPDRVFEKVEEVLKK